MAKEIKLNSKNLITIVDDEDFKYLNEFNWHLDTPGYVARTIRIGERFKQIRMHRLLLNITDSNIKVDHINGNILDNRKENLRLVTNSQNSMNRGKSKNNTSGYKGIDIRNNKFRARITVNKKQIHLGMFDKIDDAANAYNKAAEKYFGEFNRKKTNA